ncbi:NACHT domain-containing protein [Streptomyces iconiensis]|uniref:NACHT domain-containing protein n=1 Tax=Streptomyces iconiensis TaxID=1384038 RepID=A0ABT6ZZZ0_9ACTN|nr:NACHT domain-containing protein [Streptomyces iconiensis]MDJ1134647.1 NACHT domain-containing protein [Streptomyces iconiensis]
MDGGGTGGTARWENRITGGTFGTVIQAERVDAVHIHVHEEQVAPPRPAHRLFALAVLLACTGAVLVLAPPALLDLAPAGERLPGLAVLAAAALAATAGAGRVLERRRRARPRTPLPAHRLDRAAEGLADALTRQYGGEDQLALSPVSTPTPIPVRWHAADPLVTDHEPNVLGDPAAHAAGPRGVSLEVAGEFAGAAAFFASLPRQRLVILGEPGAGKTVLAQRLARTLLEARGPASGAPVPVMLPLASWNPGGGQGLWQWAAERLCAEHPVALPTPEAALDLIASGRVLPVLDGFDELPRPAQPHALRELRASLTEHARCVLTSRTAEYGRAVDGAALPLPGAVAIELRPLTTDDLARYLPRTSRRTSRSDPSHTKWSYVLARLADPADTARETRVLRRVLSTPLMVALARVAYSETDGDPAELLGAGRFTTRQAVERHLYDAFLTAAYADTGRERAEQARGWASFLAGHTRRFGGLEIAWWRLEEALPGPLRRLSVLPAVAVATLTVHHAGLGTAWWDRWVPVPLWAGFGLALCAYVGGAYGGLPARAPQQLRLPRPADMRQVSRWRALGKLAGWTALAGCVAFPPGSVGDLDHAALGVLLVALFGARSAARWLLARARPPADPETAAEPARLLHRDRRATLALGFAPTSKEDEFALVWPLPALLLGVWHLTAGRDVVTTGTWLGTVAGVLLSGWLYENATSAWGRYTLARLWFAATGRLPWQLMDFLREAHSKGVLRQSGGVYRFRHIELRNRLAADTHPAPEPRRWAALLREQTTGGVAGLSGLLLATLVFGMLNASPAPGPHHTPASVCAPLTRDALGALMEDPRRITRTEPRPDPDRVAGDETCFADEQAPFRPEVQVSVQVRTLAGDLMSSGPARAAEEFGQWLRAKRQWWKVSRKGAPKGSMAFDDSPVRGADETVRVVSDVHLPVTGRPSLRVAEYLARDANQLITVKYAEESASLPRAAAVAESLLRRALGRSDARDLASVPRSRPLPETSRLGYYRRTEQRLHGRVWGADERSFVWDLTPLTFAVRAPKDLVCDRRYKEPDAVDAYECRNVTAGAPGPARQQDPTLRPRPRIRLHAAELDCGKRCSTKESLTFLKSRPGTVHLPWRRDRERSPYYAVRRTAGTYELSLFGQFRNAIGEPRQLWVSVRVPRRDAALAQKIVNSAYTQVGGKGG